MSFCLPQAAPRRESSRDRRVRSVSAAACREQADAPGPQPRPACADACAEPMAARSPPAFPDAAMTRTGSWNDEIFNHETDKLSDWSFCHLVIGDCVLAAFNRSMANHQMTHFI